MILSTWKQCIYSFYGAFTMLNHTAKWSVLWAVKVRKCRTLGVAFQNHSVLYANTKINYKHRYWYLLHAHLKVNTTQRQKQFWKKENHLIVNQIYRVSILYIFRKSSCLSHLKNSSKRISKKINLNRNMYAHEFIQQTHSIIYNFLPNYCLSDR